jgi:hypothetical protein
MNHLKLALLSTQPAVAGFYFVSINGKWVDSYHKLIGIKPYIMAE